MSLKLKYKYDNFPTWAMSALINGDESSFNREDSQLFNGFINCHSDVLDWDYDYDSLDNPKFNSCPLFGDPCDVVSVSGYVSKEIAEQLNLL